MHPILTATALVVVLNLSGCAAALVYDRDRPANDCRDSRQRCLQSGLPAGERSIRVQFATGQAVL